MSEALVAWRVTRGFRGPALALGLCLALAGCGQKGPLYLPDEARDVVTRPAPPETAPQGSPQAPNTPGTVDTPPQSPNPAPEVTAPEGEKPTDKDKKRETAQPPH